MPNIAFGIAPLGLLIMQISLFSKLKNGETFVLYKKIFFLEIQAAS